jgi:hypothetical protein
MDRRTRRASATGLLSREAPCAPQTGSSPLRARPRLRSRPAARIVTAACQSSPDPSTRDPAPRASPLPAAAPSGSPLHRNGEGLGVRYFPPRPRRSLSPAPSPCPFPPSASTVVRSSVLAARPWPLASRAGLPSPSQRGGAGGRGPQHPEDEDLSVSLLHVLCVLTVISSGPPRLAGEELRSPSGGWG